MRISKLLNQHAVYWAKGPPRTDGKQTFLDPVQIKCRWEDTQIEVKDATKANGVWSAKSVIDTEYEVEKGGYLWRGKLAQLTTLNPADPKTQTDSGRVEYVDGIPGVSAAQTLYTAYL